jgi:hypothetical protein
VPGPLQPTREDVRGSGDRQRGPGGQRAGKAADPDVQPDLGPVVAGCLPDDRDQVAGGAADGADPLPFGGVPVPAGARLGLGGGLVQHVGDGSVGAVGRPVAAGVPAAGGQPEDVPQVSECRLDVSEAVSGRAWLTARRPARSGGGNRNRGRGWLARHGLRAAGGEPEGVAHGGEGAADVAEIIIAGTAADHRSPALRDRVEHALKLVR